MRKVLLGLAISSAALANGANAAPFEVCPTQAFLMQDNPAQLYSVDLATGFYQTIAENVGTDERVNAIGFSTHDAYLYGWSREHGTIVRIGDDYTVDPLGTVTNVPSGSWFFVGDVSLDENSLFVYRRGSSYGLYKVPLDENDANFLSATRIVNGSTLNLRIFDIAFHPTNGFLYSVTSTGDLVKIDPADGSFQTIANIGESGTYGSVYFDADGAFYISRNSDGFIFKMDPEADTVEAKIFAYGPSSGNNDGARCALAPPINQNFSTVDFGDAPDSYGSLLSSGGARHSILGASNLRLGNTSDGEADAYVFPNSDDAVGLGNDDGVQFISSIVPGESFIVKVSASGAGVVNAFLDWNGDGDFDDVNEATGDISVVAGDQLLTLNAPATAVEGDSWARFRLSSSGGLAADGAATDGEVEDYEIDILPCDNCVVVGYPSLGTSVTLAYEDLWPSIGDYDMNDLVMYYRTQAVKSGNDIVSVRIEGDIAAVGAEFHNGFAVRLPDVDATNIDTDRITFKINGVEVDRDALEAGRNEAIIVVTNDVWEEVSPSYDCRFFRTETDCDEPISWGFSIDVPFEDVVSDEVFTTLRFDPFLFGTNGFDRNVDFNPTNGRDLEVHLKNVSNTEAADTAFLNASWDASSPAQGLYYLGENGIPFALEISGEWKHPLEGVDIVDAYPDFINYVLSGGTTHTDWHLLENADQSKIYPH